MRTIRRHTWVRTALAGTSCLLLLGSASAQTVSLPELVVTSSRLGLGIAGTSTTVITSEDIVRSPAQTLPDILSREPGIQVHNFFGGVGGVRNTVDMRGFGAAATSNTLVLINGRRLNDIDMAAVDFAAIPLNSIERIEIIRGNSGAVLYGDGAMGGVINIVTKTGAAAPSSVKLEGGAGSFQQREGRVSINQSIGPVTLSTYGNIISSDGYRQNNAANQRNVMSEARYKGDQWSVFANLSADDQHVGLPGGRRVTLNSSELVTNRRGAATPYDYADKQGIAFTTGVTGMVVDGVEVIVDGGVRQKMQQGAFYGFILPTDPLSYLDTTLTTFSLTPRVKIDRMILGMPWHILTGVDVYRSDYDSDRSQQNGAAPIHRYNLGQTTFAGYWQQTVNVRPDTDVSGGIRVQRTTVTARDALDTGAPGYTPVSCFFGSCFGDVQGLTLDKSSTNHAAHIGLEHRFNESFAVFARAAQSFRVPNVDERVGMAPSATPTTFDMKTQTSQDVEAGVRVNLGGFRLQSSAYQMNLKNEIHYTPATFTNVNLDPTRRSGVETVASYQLTETVQIKGGLAYTRAVFREGVYAGKDVPLVSRWTGSAGASWDIWSKYLVADVVARFVGSRRMDNDQPNVQPLTPAHTVVDLRFGGVVDRFNWSIAVENLFNSRYFDYAIASAFTLGTYNAYPQPGRTIMARAGVTF